MARFILFFIAILIPVYQFAQNGTDKNLRAEKEIDHLITQARKLDDQDQYKESLSIYKMVIKKAKKTNYSNGILQGNLGAAKATFTMGYSNESTLFLVEAEKYANDDPLLMTRIYLLKALNLQKAGLLDEAINKYNTGLKYAKKVKDNKAQPDIEIMYNNMGNVYTLQEQYDPALYYTYKGYASHNQNVKIQSAISLSEIYLYKNKIDSAQKYMIIADDYIKNGKNIKNPSILYHNSKGIRGLLYIKQEKYEQAVRELKGSWGTSIQSPEELLAIAYSKLNKKDSANFYAQKYFEYSKDRKASDIRAGKGSTVLYNDEKSKLEMKNRQYQENKKLYFVIIGLSIVGITLLVLIIYYGQKRSKQHARALKAEKNRLEAEKEMITTKQEQLQKQALATSVQLQHKNTLIKELQGNLQNTSQLSRLLKDEEQIDNNFNTIQEIIQETHPDFFNRLHEQSKNKLSNLDLKYATYIYLNMDNVQIANIMKVDPKTVSVTKYRLKQKLGIDKGEDLHAFIRSLNV